MAHLTKSEVIEKLTPYGITTETSLARLIREQGLPVKRITPRKLFFEEDDINLWLIRRNPDTAQRNTDRAKALAKMRKARKEGKTANSIGTGDATETIPPKPKKAESVPISA